MKLIDDIDRYPEKKEVLYQLLMLGFAIVPHNDEDANGRRICLLRPTPGGYAIEVHIERGDMFPYFIDCGRVGDFGGEMVPNFKVCRTAEGLLASAAAGEYVGEAYDL